MEQTKYLLYTTPDKYQQNIVQLDRVTQGVQMIKQ